MVIASPQVIIASALPYVGNGVTTACSQLTSVVAKIEKVLAMSEKADTLIQDSKKGKASKKVTTQVGKEKSV